jgi:N-acetylneuraminic acid mutarotase
MYKIVVFVLLLVAIALGTNNNNQGGNWRLLNTNGVGPGIRDAVGITSFDDDVYIFGGINESLDPQNFHANIFYNDIYKFHIPSRRWTKLNANPDPVWGFPTKRAFCLSGRNGRDFIIGFGINYTSDFSAISTFNDMWAYNTQSNRWRRLRPNDDVEGPVNRGQPAGEVYNGKAYIFGGVDAGFSSLGDFWIFDLATNEWTQQTPAVLPSRRHGTDYTLDRDAGRFWMYAGERLTITETGLSAEFAGPDAHWYLDLETDTWVPINAVVTIPNRSSGNGLAVVAGKMFLFGGDIGGGTECPNFITLQNNVNETWTYNTNTNAWNQLCPQNRPPNLKRARMIAVGSTIYMFGGFAFDSSVCSPITFNTDVWAYTVTGCEGGPSCQSINN